MSEFQWHAMVHVGAVGQALTPRDFRDLARSRAQMPNCSDAAGSTDVAGRPLVPDARISSVVMSSLVSTAV